jgi:hypothetical protein
MAEIKQQAPQQKQPAATKQASAQREFFTKENFKWMIIGGVIIILGMILLSGGKNEDPNVFDPNIVYSTTRITVAPILIIAGLLVELYAILKKPREKNA